MDHETDSLLEEREMNGVGCSLSILKFLVKVQDVNLDEMLEKGVRSGKGNKENST